MNVRDITGSDRGWVLAPLYLVLCIVCFVPLVILLAGVWCAKQISEWVSDDRPA